MLLDVGQNMNIKTQAFNVLAFRPLKRQIFRVQLFQCTHVYPDMHGPDKKKKKTIHILYLYDRGYNRRRGHSRYRYRRCAKCITRKLSQTHPSFYTTITITICVWSTRKRDLHINYTFLPIRVLSSFFPIVFFYFNETYRLYVLRIQCNVYVHSPRGIHTHTHINTASIGPIGKRFHCITVRYTYIVLRYRV